MADLKDYSTPFDPDRTLEDFDKDVLVKMWHSSSFCFANRMGEWYYMLLEKAGKEPAQQITRDVWIRAKTLDYEERYVAAGVGVPNRDLIGLLKSMQWDVGQQGIIDTTLELVDNNPYHGRAIIHKCVLYDMCWGSGDFDLMELVCNEVCLHGYEQIGRWYNPHIQSVTIKMPKFEKTEEKDPIPCMCDFYIPGQMGKIETTRLDDYSGPELDDYSGPFLPGRNTDENAKKFSKKVLAGIIEAAGKHESALSSQYAAWTDVRLGTETAYAMDREQSTKSLITDMAMTMEGFGIAGDDVETLFKCLQVMSGRIAKMPEVEFDLKDNKHGILTVKKCRSIDYCKKYGRTIHQEHLCNGICGDGFPTVASVINPAIKVTPLKMPRRQRNGWEIWNEEKVIDGDQALTLAYDLMKENDWPALGPVECQWEFELD